MAVQISLRTERESEPKVWPPLCGTLLVCGWVLVFVGAFLPGVQFFGIVRSWVFLAAPFLVIPAIFEGGKDTLLALLSISSILGAEIVFASSVLIWAERPPRWLKRFAWVLLLIWTPLVGMAAQKGRIPEGIYVGVYVICLGFTLAFIALWLWKPPARPRAEMHLPRTAPQTTQVFVYGTLKRGGENYQRFTYGMVTVERARIRGRMYLLKDRGYPTVRIPAGSIVAKSTGDFVADRTIELQTRFNGPPAERCAEVLDWPVREGELLTFNDARDRLARLDVLEMVRPDGSGEYIRCLIWTEPPNAQLAWIYVAPPGWEPDANCLPIERFPVD